MHCTRFSLFFTVLHLIAFCLGEEFTRVIDTEEQLTGSIQDSFYVESASQVPAEYVPEEIRQSEGIGYWLLSSSNKNSVISLNFDTSFLEIDLKYYTTEAIECYIQDLAQDESEIKVVLPASANNGWSTTKFELSRNIVSEALVNFRFVFLRGTETPFAYFLLDSISYITEEPIIPTTTPQPATTPAEPETTTESDDSGRITTIIDTEDELTGSIQDSIYVSSASDIPKEYFPEEIHQSEGVGYWLLSSSSKDTVISLNFATSFWEIDLKYYNTEAIECYIQDLAQDESEVKLTLPGSSNNEWTTQKFEVERSTVSEAPVNLRLVFPRGTEAPLAFFLLDTISYVSESPVIATTTVEPTTPEATTPAPTTAEPTTPEPSTPTLPEATTESSNPEIIKTVIDVVDELTGSINDAYYFETSSQVPPDYFPEEILTPDGVGFWLFSSSHPGANISLNFDTTFFEIVLSYYNTEPIECYFQDWAESEAEVKLVLPASSNNKWSSTKFELERNAVDDAPVTFRFVFPNEEAPAKLFLLDKISYSTSTEIATTPTDETTTTEGTTTEEGDRTTTESTTTDEDRETTTEITTTDEDKQTTTESTTTDEDKQTTTESTTTDEDKQTITESTTTNEDKQTTTESTTTDEDKQTTTEGDDGDQTTPPSKSSVTSPAFTLLFAALLVTLMQTLK